MNERMRRGWLTAAMAATLLVLTGVLYLHRQRLSGFAESLEDIRPLADRALTADRLIGASLPEIALPPVQGDSLRRLEDGPARILWFVQLDECSACLDRRLRHWHALTQGTDLQAALVLTGTSATRAERAARRADVRGRVLVDTDGSVAQALGFRTPSVSLVQGRSGVVLMADARFAGTDRSCGWSFFRQVEALFAEGASDRIRSAGAPSR